MPKKKGVFRRLAIGSSIAFVFLLIAGEAFARFCSVELGNGMPGVQIPGGESAPLLPFVPSSDVVDDWELNVENSRFVVPDPDLGWCVALDSEFEVPLGRGKQVTYRSNSQGFRTPDERTYGSTPPEGRVRVVLTGDSFTFGSDVDFEDSWGAQLEASDPRLEVVNLGVPSFGCDQAFLRWRRDGRELAADVVVLGIWPEDLCRNLNVLRYFFSPDSGYLMAKPRFRLAGDELELIRQPVPEVQDLRSQLRGDAEEALMDEEYWLDPAVREDCLLYSSRLYRSVKSIQTVSARRAHRGRLYDGSDPAAYDLLLAMAQAYRSEVEASGGRFLVVILPQRDLIGTFDGGEEIPLSQRLREVGVDVVDAFPTFAATPAETRLFLPTGHFNRRGHALVAQQVGAWMGSVAAEVLSAR